MTDNALTQNRIADLPFGEQFLLWAIRHWVMAFTQQGDRHAMLHKGFRLAGIEEGYLAIDELLTIVSASATSRIEVRCPDCSTISNDEQILVGMIAALQRSDSREFAVLLGFWVAPAGVRLSLAPATRLASLMALGGLTLRRREITPPPDEAELAAPQRPLAGRPARKTLH